jgi:hypothetical protein
MDRNIISKYGTKNKKQNIEEKKKRNSEYNINNIEKYKKEQSQVYKKEWRTNLLVFKKEFKEGETIKREPQFPLCIFDEIIKKLHANFSNCIVN